MKTYDAGRSLAALVRADRIVGYAYTSAREGETVSYGLPTEHGLLREAGRAKLVRDWRMLERYGRESCLLYAVGRGDRS